MFLWAAYQICNVVIVMNLFIALMNATILKIKDDKITNWRYTRTQVTVAMLSMTQPVLFQIWRQYFDQKKISCLPVPFNILEMGMNLIMMMAKPMLKKAKGNSAGVSTQELNGNSGVEENDYLKLVSEICCRYIKKKKRSRETHKQN